MTVKKRCDECGETKNSSDFHVVPTNPEGRHNTCRVCRGLTLSLTKRVLAQFDDQPRTSVQVARAMGIEGRACRSRIAILVKRGDLALYEGDEPHPGRIKRYVRAGGATHVPIEKRLCHASNDWVRSS